MKIEVAKEKCWLADCEYTHQIHQGVDVVCSNMSLGLESTSSVETNDCSFPRPVHQHKKGKTTLTTAENSSGEVQKIDHAPTRLLVDRSTSSTFPPGFQASFSRQLNSSEIYVFCSFEWSPSAWKPKEVHWGEKKASRDLGYRPWRVASSGEEKRRSIEMCKMRMRHDAMSGCAG